MLWGINNSFFWILVMSKQKSLIFDKAQCSLLNSKVTQH